MTADESALLAAIHANPDDDLPRLMLADEWELTQPERAEFIRVQVELAGPLPDMPRPELTGPENLREWNRRDALRRRERELLTPDRAGEWVGLAGWKVHRGDFEPPTVRFYLERDRQNDGLYVEFHRGFPAEVAADVRTLFGGPCGTCEARTGEYRHPADDPTNQRLEGDTWYTCMTCRGTGRAGGVGGRLLAACPTIERVTVTDVQPVRLPPGWVFEDRDDVPAPIRSVIGRTHRTRDAAHAALSAAVLALLRERAKGVTG